MSYKRKPPAAATGRGQGKAAGSNQTRLDSSIPRNRNQAFYNLPDAGGLAIPPETRYKQNKRWNLVSRDWKILILHCPYCGKQHSHGWGPNQEQDIQSRIAHCGQGEYAIYQVGIYGEGES